MLNWVLRRRTTYPLLLISLGLLFTVVLLAGGSGAAPREARPKTVLLLDSFHREIPWSRLFHEGFFSGLADAREKPRVIGEFMDASRFPGHIEDGTYVAFLERKYAEQAIDLLVAQSGPAALLLAKHPDLFSGTPRLFVNPARPVVEGLRGDLDGNVITAKADIHAAFDHMLAVAMPKHVVVIGETATPVVRHNVAALREDHSVKPGTTVEFLLDLPLAELLNKVADLPPDTAIFYILIFRDGTGRTFVPYDAVQQISAHASAPVFTHWDSLLGSGVVGGYLLSATRVGEVAARETLSLLAGNPSTRARPRPSEAFEHVYDWRVLDRFNIPLSRVPADSKLLHRKESAWSTYRPLILGAGIAAVLSGVLGLLWIVTLRRTVRERTASLTREIAERERIETELVSAKHDAERANTAKSEFLASMSHELRSPLNAVLGFAQMLKFDRRNVLSSVQTESVESILSGGNHLLKLINEILDLARVEAGRMEFSMENVNVSAVVEECVTLTAALGEQRNITLVNRFDEVPAHHVVADPLRFKQALINLLSNAVKYNRDRGTVTVAGRPTVNGYLRISVTDTGFGISEEHRGAVFEIFNRLGTDAMISREGAGIGLAVTRLLVENMDGRIGFDSEEGQGSTFWIELPLARMQSVAAPAGPRAAVQ